MWGCQRSSAMLPISEEAKEVVQTSIFLSAGLITYRKDVQMNWPKSFDSVTNFSKYDTNDVFKRAVKCNVSVFFDYFKCKYRLI